MGDCLHLPLSSAIIKNNNNNNKKTLIKNLQKYCLQLARIFDAGQCVQNIKIETKAINTIILSRGLIQLSGLGKLRTRYLPVKATSEHCCFVKGLCQNNPLPTPLILAPRPDPLTHC